MKATPVKVRTTSAGLVRVPGPTVEQYIHLVRGYRVMLDSDLAKLYHVETKVFNQAVTRNRDRFPKDFMFQLTAEEAKGLRSQFVTLKEDEKGRGQHRKYAPYAFTEHGVAMLSSVLRSKRAVNMNIVIVRAFVKLRQILASHTALARRIEKMEATQKDHAAILSIVVNDIETLSKNMAKEFRRLQNPRRRKPRIG